MTSINFITMCVFFNLVFAQYEVFEGDRCKVKSTGEKGKCVLLDNCDYAKNLLKSRQRPQHCGFKGLIPIVCCPLATRFAPGEKSEKQCGLYYPKGVNTIFIHGGKAALSQEYTHMAILGYGDKKDIQWLCGGSLISDQFVLTAAHCLISRNFGIVKWVRLGDLDIKNLTDDAKPQDFNITTHFVYPGYKPYSHYHDIALLRLEKRVEFNSYIKPACLYGKTEIPDQLTATGWGQTDYLGETSKQLMEVSLNHIPNDQCIERFLHISKRKLENGIVDNLQICAGHPDGKDTCQVFTG